MLIVNFNDILNKNEFRYKVISTRFGVHFASNHLQVFPFVILHCAIKNKIKYERVFRLNFHYKQDNMVTYKSINRICELREMWQQALFLYERRWFHLQYKCNS